jgi:hypothetical protein
MTALLLELLLEPTHRIGVHHLHLRVGVVTSGCVHLLLGVGARTLGWATRKRMWTKDLPIRFSRAQVVILTIILILQENQTWKDRESQNLEAKTRRCSIHVARPGGFHIIAGSNFEWRDEMYSR